MQTSEGIPMMENIKFKLWLQVYQWRKGALVCLASTLILMGFFFMMAVIQFEESPTTKRNFFEIKNERLQSKALKHEYTTVPKQSNTKSRFLFLVNEPHFCIEQKYLYIIAISSLPKNFEKRMAIRETWGNVDLINQTNSAVIFLLGKVQNMRLQKQIYEESMSYRDIIQGNFIDSHKNLTQKSIMALKWFSSYCSQVRYLMKTDDDTYINTEKLFRFLDNKRPKKRWLVGCVKTHATYPVKIVSNNAFPVLSLPYRHPVFLDGAGYIMSNDTVEPLYETSQRLKIIPVEDVFVTGHCAKAIGILPEHNSRFSCGEAVRDYCILAKTMFTGHRITAENQAIIWNHIHDPENCKGNPHTLKIK